MFKEILVPISSEFYSTEVLQKSLFLAELFHSHVHVLYIIEKNLLEQMDKISDTHLTHHERTKTHTDLLWKQRKTADTIIFENIKTLFTQKNIQMKHTLVHGEFSTSVITEINKKHYDLIIMGYEKQCMIDYSLIDNITIPIWIEGEGDHQSILAVCSNLAPNKKVPSFSVKLSEKFQWPLSMLYVIDTQDTVQVDTNGIRSSKKATRDLLFSGQNFVEDMKKKGINVKTVQGPLEQQTIKEAKKMEAGLVIIGREQKKHGILGLPVKKVKQKMVEKCKYSLLFLN